ncbi:M16 family metallopeptidase [Nocardioides acrostichi]|uniref:Insulinase family protein n=1 Tax=Nocardioides acrostichi TaxID=2784339 RepID=A0A930UZN5_9ACTN|nr:pitrilysin family protein [Nocardioides acrostichi]MBF4160519.1 insulinase family protein [Nocardioides acrostichi]
MPPETPLSTSTLHTETAPDGTVTAQLRQTTLPSGLRIVTEQLAGARSASIGVWVGVGSADESDVLHGCSHFLEHLLFKGTSSRSAMDISVELDAVGGEFNAFTAKEYTCFHARVLGEDLPLAIDVLGDMLTDSLLEDVDVEAERAVILDEIAMHDDDPDDVVHNLFAELAYGADTPLGRPIAGTVDSIEALSRTQVHDFYTRHYRPESMVVSAAGRLDHEQVVDLVQRAFGRNDYLAGDATPLRRVGQGEIVPVHAGRRLVVRPFEQANLVVGAEGIAREDPRRFALGVLNTALGGGTSSRLFQEVRERRGLAYSVYSFAGHHADTGLVGVSVGCLPAKAEDVLDVVRHELAVVARDGLTDAEVRRGQGQLRGGLVLGLEDSGARMARWGKSALVHRESLGVEQALTRIETVTVDDVREVARAVLAGPEILAVVAPE